jgi:Zn-finger nucleic acid-binding protein
MRDAPPPAPCPHCATAMREVAARSRNGYLIMLDQCPRCGGVWCDRWELYPLAAEEAARIDGLDADRLQAPAAPPAGPGRCPRCTCALRRFHDPMLPPDARIERCPVCDGMWLNRGELARVKAHAVAKPAPPAALAKLAAAYGSSAGWTPVANLDAATYAADTAAAGDEDLGSALRESAPWLILRALLHLLLRV